MRIVFFVSSMQGGGAERIAAFLCNHWSAKGHEVSLIPTFSGRGKCNYSLDENVHIEYLADRIGSTRKSPGNKLRRFLELRKIIKERDADVVISFLTDVNVAVLLASRGLSVPLVVSERIYPPAMPLHWMWKVLRLITYPWARAVVMQTEDGVKWLQHWCPKATPKLIPNPVIYPLPKNEPQICPEECIPEGKKLLIGAGRLEEQKGFDILLQAFASLQENHSDWVLVILGEGRQREVLEQEIDALGLCKSVYLPGRVGNLSDWYKLGGIYVMSSRFEGFPNVLLEAMTHQLPIVSFDCKTGPRDIIREDKNGILVPPEQGALGLASAINSLMVDEEKRLSMGKTASEVLTRFSRARIAALWDELLEVSG